MDAEVEIFALVNDGVVDDVDDDVVEESECTSVSASANASDQYWKASITWGSFSILFLSKLVIDDDDDDDDDDDEEEDVEEEEDVRFVYIRMFDIPFNCLNELLIMTLYALIAPTNKRRVK